MRPQLSFPNPPLSMSTTPPRKLATPGVHINEINAFPNAVAPVATAIPAFIGYTPRASYQGKPYTGVPVQITSFQEFQTYFALLDAVGNPLPAMQQCAPVYFPVPARNPLAAEVTLAGKAYEIEADAGSVYYLYNSVQLFYQNGGGTCYVVSAGSYGPPQGHGNPNGAPLVNPNVDVTQLTGALAALKQIEDVTIIVVPEATLLKAADNAALNQQILQHCGELQSCVALFDIPGGAAPDPVTWPADDIAPFRTAIGVNGLNYGIAYYPFLKTGVMTDADIDYRNVGGGAATLSTVLLTGGPSDATLKTLIDSIGQTGAGVLTPAQIESGLRNASPDYQQLHNVMLEKINVLPPTGAMAGVYTMVDAQDGVWKAPANVSLVNVTDVTVKITDQSQQDLNVDAATGKSINAIRLFAGQGVIVWGARTLDGNSQDWRYVNVRRTLIMIEQTIKAALKMYVFEPNNASTWTAVTSVLNNFLTSLWKQGALAGPGPEMAFSVACGLGATMTAQDILDGIMIVVVKVAIVQPAQFIVITTEQQMMTS